MNAPEQTPLERMVALEADTERRLDIASDKLALRNLLAITRGYIDLARNYGEPLDVPAIENALARAAECFPSYKRRAFLLKVRSVAGWAKAA
jgi:hypothetical protein